MSSDLPAGWTLRRLGDHCTKIGSGATPRGGERAYRTSGVAQLVRSQNVLDNRFTTDGLVWIDEEAADKLRGVRLLAHDVLLNITGQSVARCSQAPGDLGEARVNQHVAIVRPDPEVIDPAFMRYWLVAHKPHLLQAASAGATREALTKRMIEDLNIACPPPHEQQRIVRVLRAFDNKIGSNSVARQKGLDAATALAARLAFQARMVPLSTLASIERTSVRPSSDPDEIFDHFSLPAFDDGMWPAADTGADIASNKFLVDREAVLVSKLNPATRRVWWLGEAAGETRRLASTEFVVLVPKAGVPSSWLYVLLARFEPLWEQVLPNVSGTTSSHQRVKPEHYLQVEAPALDNVATAKWNATGHLILEHLRRLHAESQHLAALRDALMLRLVTGRLQAPQVEDAGEVLNGADAELLLGQPGHEVRA